MLVRKLKTSIPKTQRRLKQKYISHLGDCHPLNCPRKFQHHFLFLIGVYILVIPFGAEDLVLTVEWRDIFFGRPFAFDFLPAVPEAERGVISPKAANAFVIILFRFESLSCPGGNATSKISLIDLSTLLAARLGKSTSTYTVSPVDNCPSLFFSNRKV